MNIEKIELYLKNTIKSTGVTLTRRTSMTNTARV